MRARPSLITQLDFLNEEVLNWEAKCITAEDDVRRLQDQLTPCYLAKLKAVEACWFYMYLSIDYRVLTDFVGK